VNLELSGQIFEKHPIIKFHKNPCPVGAEIFHADGQRDMTNLIVAFCNFANASQNRAYF